ncbi:MAG TPA: Smr/MutS family protein [Thermodesulfovibrionales bacterium]|nr:Smr/MutS family protein [Thermodesulfovibrionales bacterium]
MKRSGCSLTSLKDLKSVLESRHFVPKGRGDETRREPAGKTDEDIFSEAMADVREIPEFREIPCKVPPRRKYRSARAHESNEALERIVTGRERIRLSDTGEYIEWSSPLIRRDVTKRLHEGGFAVQDSIDLHGMTLVEAEEALKCFFAEAIRRRSFCVKVIHGRGLRSPNGPVIKEAMKVWLQRSFRKRIVAYATAKDRDGGLGATYVLLKQR